MKTKNFMKRAMLFACAVATLGFTSCNDNDNDDIKPSQVPAAVQEAFSRTFPGVNAASAEWEYKQQAQQRYLVASFWKDGVEHDAWFTSEGQWTLTEQDFARETNRLPQVVQDAFRATTYAQSPWVVEDIDVIRRNGYEPFYVIEVEQGSREVDLYFDANGKLLKELQDTDQSDDNQAGFLPQQIPAEIQSYVDNHFRGGRIVELEREQGNWELDLISAEGYSVEIVFDAPYQWLSTTTDYRRDQIPAAVNQSVKSKYPAAHIDDAELLQNTQNTDGKYVVEIENPDRLLTLSLDGTILTDTPVVDD